MTSQCRPSSGSVSEPKAHSSSPAACSQIRKVDQRGWPGESLRFSPARGFRVALHTNTGGCPLLGLGMVSISELASFTEKETAVGCPAGPWGFPRNKTPGSKDTSTTYPACLNFGHFPFPKNGQGEPAFCGRRAGGRGPAVTSGDTP